MLTLILVGLLAVSSRAMGIFGPCPDRPRIAADLTSFSGDWYVVSSMGVYILNVPIKCETSSAAYNETSNSLRMIRTATLKKNNVKYEFSATGTPDEKRKSIIVVPDDGMPTASFNIHDTDYTNYALVSSCVQRKFGPTVVHSETAFVLTRQRYNDPSEIPEEIHNKLENILDRTGLGGEKFMNIEQTDC